MRDVICDKRSAQKTFEGCGTPAALLMVVVRCVEHGVHDVIVFCSDADCFHARTMQLCDCAFACVRARAVWRVATCVATARERWHGLKFTGARPL
jgi:hypothetical protein